MDNIQNSFDEIFQNPNPIELLGNSKNNIIEVMDTVPDLPCQHKQTLKIALLLINIVQEYLYNN